MSMDIHLKNHLSNITWDIIIDYFNPYIIENTQDRLDVISPRLINYTEINNMIYGSADFQTLLSKIESNKIIEKTLKTLVISAFYHIVQDQHYPGNSGYTPPTDQELLAFLEEGGM